MTGRVLVACVGNVLHGDDGFGVAVARRLAADGPLPRDVDLIETGIGGLSIVHQLMDGYQALIVVDVVDRRAEPGTVFVLEPVVPDPGDVSIEEWRERFSNLHLAEPSRVLLLARGLDVLPERVLLVGCQPRDCDEVGEGLSPPVEVAVAVAAARVRELATELSGRGRQHPVRRRHPQRSEGSRARRAGTEILRSAQNDREDGLRMTGGMGSE